MKFFLLTCCTYKTFPSRFQMKSWLLIFLPGFKLFVFHLSCSLPLTLKSMKHRGVCTKICQTWKISIFVCNRLHWLPKDDCIFAVGFLKMTTFWKPNSEYYNKQKMPFIFCHIRFVTTMHLLKANENSFLLSCCTYNRFFSRFQMRSWLWIFLPGFKLFVFHLSHSLLSILKSMKHRAVCSKICQSWKISIFVCNRLHWLPKDDCIFAVGFLKMTTFWKPNSEYYNKQKMPFIFCHIRFVTATHELGWWNFFLMACCTYLQNVSL